MRRIILILFLISASIQLFGQTSLPSSGTISIEQIKTVMYNIGEIDYFQLNSSIGLEQLNALSHLTDKSPPYSLSDWYGYSGMAAAIINMYVDGYGGIFFYATELGGQPYYLAQDLDIYFDYFTPSGWFSSSATIVNGTDQIYWYTPVAIPSMYPSSVIITGLSIPDDGYRRFIYYNIT